MHERVNKAAPALAFGLYLALSLLFFGTMHGYASHVFGYGGDSFTSVWCLQWWPWAIAHGLDPFVSRKVWYPQGVEMTWVTSIPALSLIGLPLTLLAGAIVTFNSLCMLAPALAAWSAFLLARHLTRDGLAAFFAGYVYGFSAYELGHMLGHLNLAMTCVVPLLLLVCLKRLAGELSRRRCVTLLTLALLAQFGISLEILCTACVFAALCWLVFLPLVTRRQRLGLYALAAEFMAAGVIVAAITSPFLFFLFRGMRHLTPVLQPPGLYSADALGFLVPGALTRVGRAFTATAGRFPGGLGEQTAFLGLPVILILTAFFARRLASPAAQGMLAMLLLLILCSLGPRLWLDGTRTGLSLPWALADKVPLLRVALPGRLTLYVFLLAGLVMGLWIAEHATGLARWRRVLLASIACLSLLPNRAVTGVWTSAQLLPFFDSVRNGSGLRRGQNALLLPFGPFGANMMWQWQARYGFNQAAGYTGLVPFPDAVDPMVVALGSGQIVPGLGSMIVGYCRAHRVGAIVAGPSTAPALMAVLRTIGWPSESQGGVVLFSDPAGR